MDSFALLEAYVNLPELLNRVEGDRELAAELFALFRDDLPAHRDALHRAIAGGDLEEAASVVHKLRGMLASLSAAHLASLASEVESAARARDTKKIQQLLPEMDGETDRFMAALTALGTGAQL
jgi:two-component system sensor histidine kinase/response regulator